MCFGLENLHHHHQQQQQQRQQQEEQWVSEKQQQLHVCKNDSWPLRNGLVVVGRFFFGQKNCWHTAKYIYVN